MRGRFDFTALFGLPLCCRARPDTAILANRIHRHEERNMAKSCLVVRAEVPDPADRARFDHWYATDHLPWAIRAFAAVRGWRCWSRTDPEVHYAFYEFDYPEQVEAAIAPDRIKPLIADFDRVWGDRVSRRREILEIVQDTVA
jgi:hypothetical protein